MELNNTLKKLIVDYGQQQNQHPFLLVDLSGGKENTHTNILLSLLRFNGYMFFKSFLTDVLNVPDWDEKTIEVNFSTQKKAVGLKSSKKSNGFIDLYIKYNDKNNREQIIVIENKINGAADTQQQMLRYIASVKENKINNQNAFDDWVKNTITPAKDGDIDKLQIIQQDCQNRHFVYLTLDNSKIPEEDSLPSFLYEKLLHEKPIIDYNPISYQDSLLQWLKDVVLPSCPYYDDGLVVAGLRQYIASLEGLLSKNINISDTVEKFVEDVVSEKGTVNDAYKSLLEAIVAIGDYSKTLSDDNKLDTCNRLARELRKAAEELIIKDSVPDDWVLHLSPTMLVLYKPDWMRIARGSYSIPFVNLFVSPSASFVDGKKINWELHIEHFSPDNWNDWSSVNGKETLHPTNHDRTAFYNLGTFEVQTPDANGRKMCIDKVIKDRADIIRIVDNVVDAIDRNRTNYKNDKEIRIELFNKLADFLIKDFGDRTPSV